MVVVSRWYGGILLGPDRFKHINNCARNILVEKNFTNTPVSLDAAVTGCTRRDCREKGEREGGSGRMWY
jgi:hypothetical protein